MIEIQGIKEGFLVKTYGVVNTAPVPEKHLHCLNPLSYFIPINYALPWLTH